MANEQTRWEILKHFTTVLRSYFGWVSCYAASDCSGIYYRTRGSSASLFMKEGDVLREGRTIETTYVRKSKKN